MTRIHLMVIGVVFALGLPLAGAQQPAPDDSAIRAVLAREADGWDKFDAKEVAAVFASDATWQNPLA